MVRQETTDASVRDHIDDDVHVVQICVAAGPAVNAASSLLLFLLCDRRWILPDFQKEKKEMTSGLLLFVVGLLIVPLKVLVLSGVWICHWIRHDPLPFCRSNHLSIYPSIHPSNSSRPDRPSIHFFTERTISRVRHKSFHPRFDQPRTVTRSRPTPPEVGSSHHIGQWPSKTNWRP
jgi:hypothetical protein